MTFLETLTSRKRQSSVSVGSAGGTLGLGQEASEGVLSIECFGLALQIRSDKFAGNREPSRVRCGLSRLSWTFGDRPLKNLENTFDHRHYPSAQCDLEMERVARRSANYQSENPHNKYSKI